MSKKENCILVKITSIANNNEKTKVREMQNVNDD